MTLYRPNGAEIAPCICAKVKHALGLTDFRPKNMKTCSMIYWVDACHAMANSLPNRNQLNVENAIAQYAEYMRLVF